MNFFKYLGVTPEELEAYIDTGLVQRQSHDTFPLDIYSYGRKAVFDNVWDAVTSKCRGIIVHRETGDVISRPFEKFHNYGSPMAMVGGANSYNGVTEEMLKSKPVVWEKVDGFMCTLYRWDGVDYIASKGSFHSVHAKWATAWYREHVGLTGAWPCGWTPIFEGLHPDLRIVVDYKDRKGLVLLALINIEYGYEAYPKYLEGCAATNRLQTPALWTDMTLERARKESLKENRDDIGTEEGYVLTWYRNIQGPPTRLKMKFVDYLRLHRMVCGVTPRRIWEALSTGNGAIKEWLDANNSTPWFEKFVTKWAKALTFAYHNHFDDALEIYEKTATKLGVRPGRLQDRRNLSPAEASVRKAFAGEFTREENKEFRPVLFKLLDKADPSPVCWSQVESMTKGVPPCRDAQFS